LLAHAPDAPADHGIGDDAALGDHAVLHGIELPGEESGAVAGAVHAPDRIQPPMSWPLRVRSRYARAVRYSTPAFLVLVSAISLAPGCLSQTYTIPKRDLQGLAQTHPEARGSRVRVIQNFAGSEAPPEAPRVYSHTTV